MSKNVLIIGSGGREHAITWKISQSAEVNKIFAAPGSFAIQQVPKAQNTQIDIKNHKEVTDFCKKNEISLVFIGPVDPLADGLADSLQNEKINVFGPCKKGARIEFDKNWSKAFMDRNNIPTARWKSFKEAAEAKTFINTADFPALVVKASGLALGKGVVVAENTSQACSAVDEILTAQKFGAAGEVLVVEELLQGEEVSLLAISDGDTIKQMLPAQDHKRIFDNDKGPNTGGMGAYCPCPLITEQQLEEVQKTVLQRAISGFKKENIKFVGVLYAGLMLTPSGLKVLEFNARFGDPEIEVILPLLESDLYSVLLACCTQKLNEIELKWKSNLSAVGVVMASRGYPESGSKGEVIKGIDSVNSLPNHIVFHSGTAEENNEIVTNGEKILLVVALAPQLALAAAQATNACLKIHFDGEQHRRDIAQKAIAP